MHAIYSKSQKWENMAHCLFVLRGRASAIIAGAIAQHLGTWGIQTSIIAEGQAAEYFIQRGCPSPLTIRIHNFTGNEKQNQKALINLCQRVNFAPVDAVVVGLSPEANLEKLFAKIASDIQTTRLAILESLRGSFEQFRDTSPDLLLAVNPSARGKRALFPSAQIVQITSPIGAANAIYSILPQEDGNRS